MWLYSYHSKNSPIQTTENHQTPNKSKHETSLYFKHDENPLKRLFNGSELLSPAAEAVHHIGSLDKLREQLIAGTVSETLEPPKRKKHPEKGPFQENSLPVLSFFRGYVNFRGSIPIQNLYTGCGLFNALNTLAARGRQQESRQQAVFDLLCKSTNRRFRFIAHLDLVYLNS